MEAFPGSQRCVTNESGNTVADHGYYAYGRDRRGSELRTDRRFTGQQSDASGLIYMNARYYDPQLGQFISPDTLVPDATNVFDYNRYMYARGNPMKYNDPTGHCNSSNPVGQEPVPSGDGDCWFLVNHIFELWNQDQSGYWKEHWETQDFFRKYIASDDTKDEHFMLNEVNSYWRSDTLRNWEKANARTQAGEKKAKQDDLTQDKPQCDSTKTDCFGITMDVVSIGGGVIQIISPGCGPGLLVCWGIGAIMGYGGTAVNMTRTPVRWTQNQASTSDLVVTEVTGLGSSISKIGKWQIDPRINLLFSLVGLMWDTYPDGR